jgi:hypothetical protein
MDPFTSAFSPAAQREDDSLKLAENNLGMARRDRAEVLAAADLLRELDGLPPATCVRQELAESVLSWASGAAFDYPLKKFDPVHLSDPEFATRLGTGESDRNRVWTPELMLRGLDYYASAVEGTTAEFRADVQGMLDGRVAALARQVRRLEAERVALVRRAESRQTRVADAALLPSEATTERVMKLSGTFNAS